MLSRLMDRTRAFACVIATLVGDDVRGASRAEFARRLVRMGLLVAAALAATVSLTASAAEPARTTEPVYQVELVIIRPVVPVGIPEDWSVEASRAAASVEAEGEPVEGGEGQSSGRMAVRTLSSGQFKLGGVDAAIARSKGYELMRHVGWSQAATARGAGLAVELADIAGDGAEPLRGTVALEQGRYLYLKLDLAYAPATPPNSLLGEASSPGPVTFTLRQNRRIKPFERHYFDHPAFGVIAMVSPVNSGRVSRR